jgi:hypothetical protein
MAIELLIEAPAPQAFKWNYEAIKEAALAKAKEYQGIIYADADEAAMKRDRADLNRIINAIEDERKRIKKACMAPYETFEAQVKDVLQPLRSAVATIDTGLTEIDRQYRDGKTGLMKELYKKAFEGLRTWWPSTKPSRKNITRRPSQTRSWRRHTPIGQRRSVRTSKRSREMSRRLIRPPRSTPIQAPSIWPMLTQKWPV